MKVIIVNCFDTYENRADLVHDFFLSQGDEVKVIQSDFSHFHKSQRRDKKKDFVFIESLPYKKNLSISRMTSHYKFARDALKIVNKEQPDLLYVLLPPNSLAKYSSAYRRKNISTKLIFDLIDLWPETMPIGKAKRFFPFTTWASIRDKNLKHADYVITECDLFQDVLTESLKHIKRKTIYLAKREFDIVSSPQLNEDEIHLAYLGSINNIIDIPKIIEIIELIIQVKAVVLHIVGDGENRQVLIEEVKRTGATVQYHGKIYETQVKQEIFDRCNFGLNIMKSNVCVGLTMKSIDYFQHGLPIINNIPSDTANLVKKYEVGINITDVKNLPDIIKRIDTDHYLRMKSKSRQLFDKLFSVESFNTKLSQVIKEIKS